MALLASRISTHKWISPSVFFGVQMIGLTHGWVLLQVQWAFCSSLFTFFHKCKGMCLCCCTTGRDSVLMWSLILTSLMPPNSLSNRIGYFSAVLGDFELVEKANWTKPSICAVSDPSKLSAGFSLLMMKNLVQKQFCLCLKCRHWSILSLKVVCLTHRPGFSDMDLQGWDWDISVHMWKWMMFTLVPLLTKKGIAVSKILALIAGILVEYEAWKTDSALEVSIPGSDWKNLPHHRFCLAANTSEMSHLVAWIAFLACCRTSLTVWKFPITVSALVPLLVSTTMASSSGLSTAVSALRGCAMPVLTPRPRDSFLCEWYHTALALALVTDVEPVSIS